MASEIIQAPNANLPPALQEYLAKHGGFEPEMSSGVSAGFGIVGYRGKVWSYKYRGEEYMQLREDDSPKHALEFVVVRASPVISKIFYIDGYVEGSTNPPDCWSVDGIKPDPAAASIQSTTCAGCPFDKWGSKVTQQGKKVKACTDSKRMAVLPLNDLDNAEFGGPMLLRVPAASLGDMAQYEISLRQRGFPAFAVGTQIKFVKELAHPQFEFAPIRPLTNDELTKVLDWRDSDQVHRMLTGPVENVVADVMEPSLEGHAVRPLSERAAAQPPAGAVAGGGTLTQQPIRNTPPTQVASTPQPVRSNAQPRPVPTPTPSRAAVTPQGNGAFFQQEQRTAEVVQHPSVQPVVEARTEAVENGGDGFFTAAQTTQGKPQTAKPTVAATPVPEVDEAGSQGQGDKVTADFNAMLDGLLAQPTEQPAP